MALNSESSINLIDLLCEGPIDGIVGNRKGVFLDETPANKKSVGSSDFELRRGTERQTPIELSDKFADSNTTIISVDTQVGENYSETLDANNQVVEAKFGNGSVFQAVADTEVDYVRLLFTIPKLFSTAVEGLARGQLFPAKIRIRVKITSKSKETFIVRFNGEEYKEIAGISTSNYQYQTPKIPLRGEGPWIIKVSKILFKDSIPGDDREGAFEIRTFDFEETPENTPLANGRGDTLVWTSIIAGKDVKTTYKHTACVGLSLSVDEFNTVPSRAYEIRGMKVQIPENAIAKSDGRLSYDSRKAFNGKLKSRHYTTCPVCCFYDMATNSRYGAGDFISKDELSWVDLIELSKYCNELITTSDGTQEPRFAINTVIASQAEAFSVLQDLASVFRGMIYWKSDTIQVAGDHGVLGDKTAALDPVHLFTNSNVVGGGFSYSGASLKTRSTRVRVRYNDPNNFYRPDFVVIENRELVNKYGFQIREIVAFGCTSKSQAQRMGKWVLASEETEGETVTFAVGLEGLMVMPGQVFAVSDAMRQGARLAGRISASTTTSVTADQAITLPTGTGPQLSCVLADGTTETKTISSVANNVINVSAAFSSAPQVQTVYSIEASNVKHQKFRCLAIGEGENGTYSITGVQHVDGIYNVVESENALLQFADITLFDEAPLAPVDLTFTAAEVVKDRNTTIRLTASWSRGSSITSVSFFVKYKIGDGNFVESTTTNTSFNIENVPPGTLVTFKVRGVGPAPRNKRSVVATTQIKVPRPTRKCPNPKNVTIDADGKGKATLRWQIDFTGVE